MINLMVLCAASVLPHVTELDRGGATFDFEAASARRFDLAADAAASLLKKGFACQAGQKLEVKLPDADGGEYRLSGRYRLTVPADYHHEAHGNGRWRTYFDGKKGDSLEFLLPSGDFHPFAKTLRIPKGVRTLTLELVEGKGCSLVCEDLALVRKMLPPVEIDQTALGSVDGTFAVSPGQLGLVMFTWRTTPGTTLDPKAVTLRLSLPKGVEFVDCSEMKPGSLKTDVRADGSSVVTFAKDAARPIGTSRAFWSQRGLLVRGAKDLVPDTLAGDATFEVLENGTVKGVMPIRFLVVAPVKAAVRPKRYFNGFDCSEITPIRFANRAHAVDYVKSVVSFGADAVIPESYRASDNALFREGGMRYVLPRQNVVINGYLCRITPKVPDEIRYVPYPDYHIEVLNERGVCPQAVYGEAPVIREKVIPELKQILAGADGMWANWEPCHYTGCFCDRCRVLFEKYLGVAEGSLKAYWPAGVVKKYKKEVDQFHAEEHAKVVLTVDRWVRQFTGGEKSLGFVPGVEWADISSCWRDENLAASYRPLAYAGQLKWIEPWGPYGYGWATDEPYLDVPSRAMAMFWGAADMRAQVDRDYPAGRRPKLMAYPHGVQCTWISQPEVIGMQLDSCLFNRWESAMLYFYPHGYDARYWRCFAEATERAARYEVTVFDGREATDRTALVPVAEFAPPCSYGTRYVPSSANASLLQGRAFEKKDGTRIVAALNFWEKGEAFFTLKAKGLSAGDYRVVDEAGVLYVKDAAAETWTAEELARGVLLEVGAFRTRVFEIVPAEQAIQATRQVTAEEMKAFYKGRKAELERAAEKARQREKTNPTPPRDYMPMV